MRRIFAAAVGLLLAGPVLAQTAGSIVLHGPSFDPALPLVTPEAIAAAVNAALAPKADVASPVLTGVPLAPTAAPGTNNGQVASTAFSAAAVLVETSRATGAEALLAPKASPTFTGTVTIPAGASISGFAPLASPALSGVPTVPTAAPGANTTQAASTAFVTGAVVAATVGVSSVNTRTGAVTMLLSDIPGVAPLASPALTGTPTSPTAAPGTNTTQIASTAFTGAAVLVETNRATTAEALLAPKASPALTGTPTAPTVAATSASGTTQLATTAFVRNGTTTSDSALAGQVGEYISSTLPFGTPVTMTTATTANITSISLTAGDWDVWGNVATIPAGSTLTNSVGGSVSLVSATLPTAPNGGGSAFVYTGNTIAGANMVLPVGMTRLSLASTTTVFLVANMQFNTSTLSSYGFIGARRAR